MSSGKRLWKSSMRPIVDALMLLALPILMAHALLDAALHEYLGLATFALFIAHHMLNGQWFRSLRKGRYHAVRTLNLIVDLALLVVMCLLPLSGIMMSEHVFAFLNFGAGIAFARTTHLLLSYWGFLLMSFHVGLHGRVLLGRFRRKQRSPMAVRVLAGAIAAAVIMYGLVAMDKRNMMDYLLLKTQFVFFDFSEPLIFFLLDHLAIMGMAACMGWLITALLRNLPVGKCRHPKERRMEETL